MAETERQVSIHYEERPDKPTLAVGGAYGGVVGPGHNVIAHVYSEWGMVPSIEQISVSDTGEQQPPKTIKRGDVNREIQATLVLTPESAMAFGKWLIEKGMLAYERRSEQGPPDVQIVEEGD